MNSFFQKFVALACICIAGYIYVSVKTDSETKVIAYKQEYHKKPSFKSQSINVHIAGAVHDPGIYEIQSTSRLIDVVKMAGGLHPMVNLDNVNYSRTLKDGQRIYIPFRNKRVDKYKSSIVSIDINRATQEELQSVPGIGAKKAKAIFNLRRKVGRFSQLEDLLQVKGIGIKTLEKFRSYFYFR